MEEREEKMVTIIGGDFNARTGDKERELRGEELWNKKEGKLKRKLKNKKVNKEAKRLVEFIRERE